MANFLALCGDQGYWGGRNHDAFYQTIIATHMWINLAGMLDLIARLANLAHGEPHGLHYKLEAGPHRVILQDEMQADEIAAALGCDVKQVVDHFRVLISVTDHA